MNVGAILDNVAGELDAQVLAYMQEYAIPPTSWIRCWIESSHT